MMAASAMGRALPVFGRGDQKMTVEKKPYVRPTLTRREKLGMVTAKVPTSVIS
jgi:hypothetical protein